MTQAEILTKAIEKAIGNGWRHQHGYTFLPNSKIDIPGSVQFVDESGEIWHTPYQCFIYDNAFAKALWGENDYTEGHIMFIGATSWEVHLRDMVIAEDPIAYLGEHL